MTLDYLPIQTESGQILSQTVGIVGHLLGVARDVEQLAARFRECAAALANGDHVRKLHSVEEVDCGELLGGEDRLQHIVTSLDRGIRRSFPAACQASDFFGHQLRRDPSSKRQRGHARDRGVEVSEVAGPMSFAAGRETKKSLASFFVERDARAATLSEAVQFVGHVWFDVFGTITQRRKLERPEIDPR